MERGEAVFNFGPYRGIPVRERPDYLDWMLTNNFAPSTMAAARRLPDKILEYADDGPDWDD